MKTNWVTVAGQSMVLVACGLLLIGCSNPVGLGSRDENGVPLFISSTLINASYLGGSTYRGVARYYDGQEDVYVPGANGVKATFYNFGFWEGDDIELPLASIDAMWHNNDYADDIRNATKKWIAEYSLYYLADGSAYTECRYKLRLDAPLNGIWYCYSETVFIGSIDISTLVQPDATVSDDVSIISAALETGQTVATGSRGDYIVKVPETPELRAIASGTKGGMFLSIGPFEFIEAGYILINVVPEYSQYRILDPNITTYTGDYYAVVIRY